MGMVRILVVILLLLPSSLFAAATWEGSTCTATTSSQADVASCISGASAKTGTVTISIPGSATWTTSTTLNFSGWAADKVVIAGAGTSTTVITVNISAYAYLFTITGKDGIGLEIKDIAFSYTTGLKAYIAKISGNIGLSNANTGFNIHGCTFTADAFSTAFHIRPRNYGVIHNNTFTGVRMAMGYNGDGAADLAEQDAEFDAAAGLGTYKFIVVENNTIDGTHHTIDAIDGYGGMKYVLRYNKLINTYIMTHGGGANTCRGVRAVEVYKNEFVVNSSKPASVNVVGFYRSGTGVTYDNSLTGTWPSGYYLVFDLEYELACNTCCFAASGLIPYRGDDGYNTDFDRVDNPACDTYPCQDQIGRGEDSGWGTEQTLEGMYAWNNTYSGASSGSIVFRHRPTACAASATMVQANRDYFNVATVTAAKAAGLAADYAAYTCPHPLAGSGSCTATAGLTGYQLGSSTPLLVSATLAANGTTLSLVFSENITKTGDGTITVTPYSGAATATYASGSGTTTLVYTVSRAITQGATLTVSYTQGGNDLEATDDGVDVGTWPPFSVTNNSTQSNSVHIVTPTASTGCNIYPSTAQSVVDGNSKDFSYTTDANYSFSSWGLTGTNCTGSGTTTYTVSVVDNDCAVVANCTKNAAEGKVGAGNSGQKIGAGNPAHKRY